MALSEEAQCQRYLFGQCWKIRTTSLLPNGQDGRKPEQRGGRADKAQLPPAMQIESAEAPPGNSVRPAPSGGHSRIPPRAASLLTIYSYSADPFVRRLGLSQANSSYRQFASPEYPSRLPSRGETKVRMAAPSPSFSRSKAQNTALTFRVRGRFVATPRRGG